jgi:hypothetical protein
MAAFGPLRQGYLRASLNDQGSIIQQYIAIVKGNCIFDRACRILGASFGLFPQLIKAAEIAGRTARYPNSQTNEKKNDRYLYSLRLHINAPVCSCLSEPIRIPQRQLIDDIGEIGPQGKRNINHAKKVDAGNGINAKAALGKVPFGEAVLRRHVTAAGARVCAYLIAEGPKKRRVDIGAK